MYFVIVLLFPPSKIPQKLNIKAQKYTKKCKTSKDKSIFFVIVISENTENQEKDAKVAKKVPKCAMICD